MSERDIRPTQEDAKFYFERLTKFCELRQSIDSGNYPLSLYSSGEAKDPLIFKDKNGNIHAERQFVSLPIYPNGKGNKGLRFLVLFGIYSSWLILKEMGLGKEADEIIVFDRSMPKGRKLLGDGKTK